MRNHLQERLLELEQKIEDTSIQENYKIMSLMKDFLELYKITLQTEDPKTSWINNRLYEIKRKEGNFNQKPLAVVHIVPSKSFTKSSLSLNLQEFNRKYIPMLNGEYGNSQRINYHGILYKETFSHSYTQLYRNGIVELVNTNFWNEDKLFYPFEFENGIITTVEEYLRVMDYTLRTTSETSVDLHISLFNVEGSCFSLPRGLAKTHNVDQPEIQLPSITIEIAKEDIMNIKDIIKPSIDLLWNAGGFVQSLPQNSFN
ncbi:hypothetical protein [Priestia megaterium]|uniref:hypothetical protein n=1 Tax=Priestia megaterium TaxID=1404 RepID=UPI0027850D51|nr:hypothetical protein [Priestia megaterium]MDQ0802754.1 hypothetical protein [Priestia megaterium]